MDTLSRRTFVSMVAATVAMPPVTLYPEIFDPAAYVADLRAAGVRLAIYGPGLLGLENINSPGPGDPYMDVCWKWAKARKACPDNTGMTIDYLLAEAEV